MVVVKMMNQLRSNFYWYFYNIFSKFNYLFTY